MSDISNIYNPANYRAESSPLQQDTNGNRFEDLKVEDFLKLMIAELQNQDPLNPSDNKEMLGQLNQMRQIVSSDKLTNSLDSIMLGQSVSTASNLIGKTITGVNQLGDKTTGVVERVVFEEGVPKVYVGLNAIKVESITEIIPTEAKKSSENADKATENAGNDW
ncbi:MAG: flagellar hook assembly protein FlgD [Thermoguttaceae bacterium]